jgi:hypothetical protein
LYDRLRNTICEGKEVQLWGVTFALLDFAEYVEKQGGIAEADAFTLVENGGMKCRRAEITRNELHEILRSVFNLSRIGGEYGMTELFSQFYKWGDQESHSGPPWTGIRVIDVHTGEAAAPGQPGYLEIIDLANFDTVSAIRTQDIAIAVSEREFILLGRDPEAVARGCSRGVEHALRD